jgi:hypothetical protein
MSHSSTRQDGNAAHPGLELEDDMRFQHRLWRIERLGWLLMALLVGTAAIFLDPGPLARSEAGDGRLAVAYDRAARLDTATEIRLRIRPGPEPVALRLSGPLLQEAEIRSSLGAALRAGAEGAFLFDVTGEVRLVLVPRGIGLHGLRAEIPATGETVDLVQLVLP